MAATLRVRDESGARWTLDPTVRFVEIYNNEGELCAVVSLMPDGRVAVSMPGDKEFSRYARAYGSKVAGGTPPADGLWNKPDIVKR